MASTPNTLRPPQSATEAVEQAIREQLAPKIVDLNLEAFALGVNSAESA